MIEFTFTVSLQLLGVLITNEMHNSYNQFFIAQFFVCSTCFERLDSFETRRADKKLWNKKLIIIIVHLVGH